LFSGTNLESEKKLNLQKGFVFLVWGLFIIFSIVYRPQSALQVSMWEGSEWQNEIFQGN